MARQHDAEERLSGGAANTVRAVHRRLRAALPHRPTRGPRHDAEPANRAAFVSAKSLRAEKSRCRRARRRRHRQEVFGRNHGASREESQPETASHVSGRVHHLVEARQRESAYKYASTNLCFAEATTKGRLMQRSSIRMSP